MTKTAAAAPSKNGTGEHVEHGPSGMACGRDKAPLTLVDGTSELLAALGKTRPR